MAYPDLPFVRDAPPPSLARRIVTFASGASLRYDSDTWSDELIIIHQGTIELQDTTGRHWPFETGSVIWLCGLPLRRLINSGPNKAVVIAVKPRRDGNQAATTRESDSPMSTQRPTRLPI